MQLIDENSIICQEEKKKGNFIRAKFRAIIQETDSQKALRTVPAVSVQGTVIHIFETKDRASK